MAVMRDKGCTQKSEVRVHFVASPWKTELDCRAATPAAVCRHLEPASAIAEVAMLVSLAAFQRPGPCRAIVGQQLSGSWGPATSYCDDHVVYAPCSEMGMSAGIARRACDETVDACCTRAAIHLPGSCKLWPELADPRSNPRMVCEASETCRRGPCPSKKATICNADGHQSCMWSSSGDGSMSHTPEESSSSSQRDAGELHQLPAHAPEDCHASVRAAIMREGGQQVRELGFSQIIALCCDHAVHLHCSRHSEVL